RGDHYVDLNAAMEDALDVGYRLFDLAELYGTEAQFGDLLRKPGSPERDTLYLVGKVWNTNHGFEQTIAACEQSLRRLGVDAFDLYLIHWPQALRHTGPLGDLSLVSADEAGARAFPRNDHGDLDVVDISLTETWRALETLLARGRAKAIGVSNFGVDDLKTILDEGTTPPAVNQIEHHPYRQQRDLVDFCHENNIRVMAYSPLAAPGLLDDPIIVDIAEKHGCTPAQVVLAWNLAQGIVPIPSSTSRAHLSANLDVFGVELDDDDRERMGGLEPQA
ncbi:MAG: aldo/keto reductase, partial [Trueperaceae bacterium]|nr:aldo/keto reductase [Trueperaceae bacterium]